jgi:hypothetical protein
VSTTAQPALQRAIYSRLVADSALAGLVLGIYDEVPNTVAPPFTYLVIDDVHELASEAHDRSGVDASVTLSAWSTYRGYVKVAEVAVRVCAVLHRPDPALAVEGFRSVSIANETHQFMRDPDPDLRRCVMRYRVWLETTPE